MTGVQTCALPIFYVGATRENTPELGALERLPGACGVKVFMGSSTGSLLIEDDDGVRNVLKAIRRRASFHLKTSIVSASA